MSQDFSRHHILPTSMGGSNDKRNIVKLVHKYHVAFHQVFNNLPPHRQIERLLDINSTALSLDFKAQVNEILRHDVEYIYEKNILIPRIY